MKLWIKYMEWGIYFLLALFVLVVLFWVPKFSVPKMKITTVPQEEALESVRYKEVKPVSVSSLSTFFGWKSYQPPVVEDNPVPDIKKSYMVFQLIGKVIDADGVQHYYIKDPGSSRILKLAPEREEGGWLLKINQDHSLTLTKEGVEYEVK